MNIEEATEMLKRIYVTEFNTSSIYDNVPNVNLAIETLLTAYEKEKEKNEALEVELEIKKYCKVNELASDLIYYKNLAREYQGNCISKDKLKEIVDECVPKKENIITRELEYTPNANANSYLTQEILSLLEKE